MAGEEVDIFHYLAVAKAKCRVSRKLKGTDSCARDSSKLVFVTYGKGPRYCRKANIHVASGLRGR